MHAVIETPVFLASAKATGLSDEEQTGIKLLVAANPLVGRLMKGTGGARKVRFAGRGKGKSGGYRIVTFYCADDVPVFLLDVYGKDEKANLTKAERNELARILPEIADTYRASVKRVVVLKSKREISQ